MITLHSIKKVFRTEEIDTWALREVSLEVKEGEFVSIMVCQHHGAFGLRQDDIIEYNGTA